VVTGCGGIQKCTVADAEKTHYLLLLFWDRKAASVSILLSSTSSFVILVGQGLVAPSTALFHIPYFLTVYIIGCSLHLMLHLHAFSSQANFWADLSYICTSGKCVQDLKLIFHCDSI